MFLWVLTIRKMDFLDQPIILFILRFFFKVASAAGACVKRQEHSGSPNIAHSWAGLKVLL